MTASTRAQLFVRIDLGTGDGFGPGKADLLAAVAATGSISAAARSMSMSYRRAWLLVDATNRLFGKPCVATSPGGRAGGGARLTPFGARVLATYRAIVSAAGRAARQDLARLDRWCRDPKA